MPNDSEELAVAAVSAAVGVDSECRRGGRMGSSRRAFPGGRAAGAAGAGSGRVAAPRGRPAAPPARPRRSAIRDCDIKFSSWASHPQAPKSSEIIFHGQIGVSLAKRRPRDAAGGGRATRSG